MKIVLPLLGAGFCSLFSSSCTLPCLDTIRGALTATAPSPSRYEVRPALAANAPFEPSKIQSYFIMVPPAPVLASSEPLRAAIPRSTQAVKDTLGGAGSPLLCKLQNVRTTAYCHDEADHIAYGHLSAMGKPLRFGSVRSAAADWSRYPLGTLFRISGQPGIIYQVDDYGSALVGTDTIDLYKPSRSLMNSWGVRHVDIEVIKWGSYHESMEIIKDRTRWPHVRRMFINLQNRLHQTASSPLQQSPANARAVML